MEATIGPHVLTRPEQADPAWLTATLAQAGALIAGSVVGVGADTGAGNWSANAQLTLDYSTDSAGERPRTLFLKIVSGFGPSEVLYYTRDYVDVAQAPLVRCYHAAYADSPRRYHLLLQDVSHSHEIIGLEAPTAACAFALADGLAAMHARWWGAQRMQQLDERIPDAAAIERWLDLHRPGLPNLITAYGDEIGGGSIDKINAVFETHPKSMLERTGAAPGFCIIHGDTNATNIFVARNGSGPPIYLIDRQPFDASLTVWLGVYDLTYAITCRWEPEIRRQLEMPLLRRYHARLQAHGVTDYPWEQLVADYSLCSAMSIYFAVEFCAEGPNEQLKWLWMPMLMKALTALDDL